MTLVVSEWLRDQRREPVGPRTALFRGGDREQWHIVEAGWPVDANVEGDDRVAVRVYPGGRAATHDYTGDLAQLSTVAQRFIASVLGQGLRFSQPSESPSSQMTAPRSSGPLRDCLLRETRTAAVPAVPAASSCMVERETA